MVNYRCVDGRHDHYGWFSVILSIDDPMNFLSFATGNKSALSEKENEIKV